MRISDWSSDVCSSDLVGQRTEAGEGVVAAVALLGRRVRGWVDEQVASFGDEEEQQPVDGAQELAVVVLLVERSILEGLPERNVGWLGEEPFPQCGTGGLHADAQLVERPGAALVGLRSAERRVGTEW